MRFLSREAAFGSKEVWTSALKAYRQHLAEIGETLPPEVTDLCKLSFHDSTIREAAQFEKSAILTAGTISLFFVGVSHVDNINESIGDVWLYEEVDMVRSEFLFRVLLEQCELYIRARSVTAYDYRLKRWVVTPHR